MIPLIKVTSLRVVGEAALWLTFSDGSEGRHDFRGFIAEGGAMVEPLQDAAFFAKAFVAHGVPTWPNGLALDAIALHRRMAAGHELAHPVSAA
jgi:hypothetical protein